LTVAQTHNATCEPTQAGKVKGKRTAKELGAIDSLESTSEAATAVGLEMAASASIELKVVPPRFAFTHICESLIVSLSC
jgi:hypothetical protein